MARVPRLGGLRALVVDDQEANVRVLQRLLQEAGADVVSTTDARQAAALYEACDPDIVLLDLHMPHVDGLEVMGQLRTRRPAGAFVPTVMLTADNDPTRREQALAAGVNDFLVKPFDVTEVLLRVANLWETRRLYLELQERTNSLESQVRARTAELEASRVEVLERLALAAEFRDDDTHEHTQRVGTTAALLARAVGLDPGDVEILRRAAPLHDLGKIGVPDHILLKPGPLTEEEFDVVKGHVHIGSRILGGSRSRLLVVAREIALTHHERWDGTGYLGLVGELIPLSGRLVAVTDVFDALTHDRPYKRAWPVERALEEIDRQRGAHFDPAVVEAFFRLWEKELAPVWGAG